MWGHGYNVSREVMLAIRQGSEKRVEHLVEGLVASLRAQRHARADSVSGSSSATGTVKADGQKQTEPYSVSKWSHPDSHLGTSIWDFICAVQRLSRRPLGSQRQPFWDEVSRVVAIYAGTLDRRELPVICSAYGAGAPERLRSELGGAFARRAVELSGELMVEDLVMILNALSRGFGTHKKRDACDPSPAEEIDNNPSVDMWAVRELARSVSKARFTDKVNGPRQAALLMNAFAKLQHVRDAKLFGHLFDFARCTLPFWNAQSLALLCNALGGVHPRARVRTTAPGNWQAVANRCADVLRDADGQHLACMAHGLANVGAPTSEVAEFYEALENLLCTRHVSERLSAQDIARIAYALAWHKRPNLEQIVQGPATAWQLEEFAMRHVRAFTPKGLAMVLEASMRLGRGGAPLFATLAKELQRFHGKCLGLELVMICEAALWAAPVVGWLPTIDLLRNFRQDCVRLLLVLQARELARLAKVLATVAEAWPEDGWVPLWRSRDDASAFVGQLRARASELVGNAAEEVREHSLRIARAEGLLEGGEDKLHSSCVEKQCLDMQPKQRQQQPQPE